MVLTRTDENELLTALYSGAFLESPWQAFLARLRARTDADLCRVVTRPVSEGPWHLAESVERRGVDPALALRDVPFDDLRLGRVYAEGEIFRESERGGRHMRVVSSEGSELGISLLRESNDFGARDSSLLASLAPHLVIALRTQAELERERRRVGLLTRTLDRVDMGWLLIDARGRLLDCDAGMQGLIDSGGAVRRGGDGRVRFPYAEAEVLLDYALAARDGPIVPRAGWMTLAPPTQMAVMPPPEETSGALAPAHCLILTRRIAAGTSSGSDAAFLSDLFTMTRSEADLALRIARGDSIAEAADALGLTLETARNYTKRIYGKTSARGQGELVRLVWGGVPG